MGEEESHPVIVVGAGPTGATAALLLEQLGVPTVVVDAGSERQVGSRAIAIHRTALQVWEQLGCAAPMLKRGIAWRTRRTYFRDQQLMVQQRPVPAPGELPVFLNLPQFETENYLLAEVASRPLIDLRRGHRVTGVEQAPGYVAVSVQTPGGPSVVKGRYLVACDGARSTVRKVMGLGFPGTSYPDRFLIADIRAKLPFAQEPRFYFDHPANRGHNILIHPQPDDVWRIDWQLPLDSPDVPLDDRIRALIGQIPTNWCGSVNTGSTSACCRSCATARSFSPAMRHI